MKDGTFESKWLSLDNIFSLLGNAALQKFVEIKPEDAYIRKEAIENIAMKKAMVYKQ